LLLLCAAPPQIAHTILSRILEDGASEGLLVLAAWLRYSAARHLTWNRNYNVKPREISAAQVQHQPKPTHQIAL
jgi:hypothetical protein